MGIRSMPFFKGKKGFQFAGGGNIDEYGDLPIATTSSAGCVKPDGTTINVTAQGGISVPTGSDTAKGILQVDNDTIKATNGVLTTDALIKVATLPAASATTLGKIFMYTGATGGGLTSGHIYKCTSAGDPAVYSWTELPVQDVSALAPKTDLSAVIATGTTNGTGSQIDAGTYFYLNGDYCVAKTDIAVNATFTLNTNYEVVTVGGVLSELNSKITQKLDISSYQIRACGLLHIPPVGYASVNNLNIHDLQPYALIATPFNVNGTNKLSCEVAQIGLNGHKIESVTFIVYDETGATIETDLFYLLIGSPAV